MNDAPDTLTPDPKPKQLLRSSDDRVFAGVAGGVAKYFAIDPIIVRIGFTALLFLGGLGLVAYVAGWLFVPEDDGSGAPKPIEWTLRRKAVAGVFLIAAVSMVASALPLWFLWIFIPDSADGWIFAALAIVALLVLVAVPQLAAGEFERDPERPPLTVRRALARVGLGLLVLVGVIILAVGSAWAAAEGQGEAVAAAVVVLGGAMVALSFGRGAAWLALPALALALPVGAVAAAGFELEGGYGERLWRPATVASIPQDGYRHAVGDAVVDLRDLDWRDGQSLDVDVYLGLGQLRVITPENVCVEADAHVDAGAIWFRGDENGGLDYERSEAPPPSSAPRLRLDADVGFGHLVIGDREYAGTRHEWRDFERLDDVDEREALERAEAACESR